MKLVKCVNERTTYPGRITVGSRYYMDENSIWKDSDGDEYATFYTYHIPSEKYKLGQFKTSHFEREIEEEKGWTITYIPWEDMEGKPRVEGRFKTTKEKDEFLEKIHKPNSGWLDEEFATLGIINDYNYMLSR